ncbi:MAG: response regulator, partial [Acidimicrobiales bacterium]
MSTAARDLRHTLRNAVNHIVGYADLLAEEAADVDPAGPLAGALAEVAGAAQDVLAETARLEGSGGPARGGPDAAMADLEPALARVAALASAMTGRAGLDGDTARALGHIVDAAGRARSLVAGAGVEEPPTTDGRGARIDLATAAPPRTTPVRPGGGSVVLVVDDDEANRDVLARRLARLGYQVRQAPDGRAALASMRRDPVDLVLLDIDMPELDGYGVLEARQADAALREVPAIIISASADIHSVVRCIGMGAEDHLQKPFDPVLLEARLGACLEKKRLRDQERQLLATVSHQAAELAELNATLEARVAAQVDELGRAARLRRFLSPPLADAIVSGGDETVLAIHRRDIAVLFVDLCGFTAFAETAEPEEVMGVLREYHAEIGKLILAHEGTLERFTGDGLMIFF